MRPVDERATPRFGNQLASHEDVVPRHDGHAWRQRNVIHDFETVAVVGTDLERFMHRVRGRAEEEARPREDGGTETHLGGAVG